jgi:TPR repeat protein
MFTFRREVAGAFIWLGQQMVEPTSASSPAPTNTSAPANNAAPANKPVTSEAKPTDQPQPASAAPGAIYTGPTDINSAPKTVAKEPVTETPPSPKKDVHALWADIAKGDIGAEMTLGNMYFTGHGVTRNCFQAHRLFAAAARKGNAEAKERLAQMENGACPL